MEIKASSVSEVVYSIKNTLESEFHNLTIVGEISNLSQSSAGHFYFSLSDKTSSIGCALFRMDAIKNPIIKKIKNGDKVLLRGPISVYAKRGTFQLICKRIVPYGKGDLNAQFEFLKEKLRDEGLFDDANKKSIPNFPKKIAVLTALRGAALQDFLNIMKRRSIWYDILICPVTVQGDHCASSIINILEYLESHAEIDLIVVTRGGGSIEDLWGFNDENLVRKIHEISTPVISAVGHQVDYTLIDYVSDLRCETPSAAAEIISQHQTNLIQRLRVSAKDIKSLFGEFSSLLAKRLEKVNPKQFLLNLHREITDYQFRLERLRFFDKEDIIGINEFHRGIDDIGQSLKISMKSTGEGVEYRLNLIENVLNGLNPKNVLKRGYSYLTLNSGKVLSTSKEFDKIGVEDTIDITFQDGKRTVKKIK